MKTAAVSEIKAALSEFLARVKNGEEVLITERGKPIARIVPIQGADEAVSARLQAMERAGLAKVGAGLLPQEFWGFPRPADPDARCREGLDQEREEGR